MPTKPQAVEFEAWCVTAGPSSTYGLITSNHFPYFIEHRHVAEAEVEFQGEPSKVIRVKVTVQPIEEDPTNG